MNLKPCTKFITNSPTKQLFHVLQEVREVLTAFISWKIARWRGKDGVAELRHMGEEITDLQTAGETLLLVLGFSSWRRKKFKITVAEKNRRRGYFVEGER